MQGFPTSHSLSLEQAEKLMVILTHFLRCVTLRHMKRVTLRELHAKTGQLVREASRHGQILVTDNGRAIAKIVPETEGNAVPYFGRRKPSAAFSRLDASGKTGHGTDVTRLISDDREDRV